MSFIINNDNNEYINIIYMKNTFKLCYNKDLWKEFTNLYYDKMINLESLFQLSNSKNLYIHINHNSILEFKYLNVFEDIKNIIKKNLDNQLYEWEKNKDHNILSSITPDTNLEKIINYFESDAEELDNNHNNFYNYLIDKSRVNINILDRTLKNEDNMNITKKDEIKDIMKEENNDNKNLENQIIDTTHKEVFLIDERCEIKISDIDSEYSMI